MAELWCQYAEMELRHKNFQRAVNVLRRATAMPSKKQLVDESGRPSVQARVHKSLKLWSMYADLEESIGTLEGTKAVYNRMLELRVATPQVIINFATFLEENKYFEEGLAFSTECGKHKAALQKLEKEDCLALNPGIFVDKFGEFFEDFGRGPADLLRLQ